MVFKHVAQTVRQENEKAPFDALIGVLSITIAISQPEPLFLLSNSEFVSSFQLD